jgi:hypothetical protein
MSIKFKAIWNNLVSLLKFGKKKTNSSLPDAIRFPAVMDQLIVEDYEVAAYHNQA